MASSWCRASTIGRPSTRTDNVETLRGLIDRLCIQSWASRSATRFDPGRQWMEEGAAILDADTGEVCELARRHGQDVVLRWDVDVLAPVVT